MIYCGRNRVLSFHRLKKWHFSAQIQPKFRAKSSFAPNFANFGDLFINAYKPVSYKTKIFFRFQKALSLLLFFKGKSAKILFCADHLSCFCRWKHWDVLMKQVVSSAHLSVLSITDCNSVVQTAISFSFSCLHFSRRQARGDTFL